MWAVIRPVQAVTEHIFIRSDNEAMAQCELCLTAPNTKILTYQFQSSYMLTWKVGLDNTKTFGRMHFPDID